MIRLHCTQCVRSFVLLIRLQEIPANHGAIESLHCVLVTGLSGRTFGVWTLVSAVVRLYGAYNLHLAP